jgi:hypothetical protein
MTARPDAPQDPRTKPADASDVTFAFHAFGLNIGLELSVAIRTDDLAGILPPGHRRITSGPLDHVFRLEHLSDTDSPVAREGFHWFDEDAFRRFAAIPEQAVEYGEAVIEHYVAEFSTEFIFIHAGVVTWQGRAVILPGASRAGKSTLVRALVGAGATYFTDEYAVLDAEGIVYPYLRHLSQREGPFGPAGRVNLAAHAPSVEEVRDGAPVALVALTRFEEGSTWRAERLGPGAAMMGMSQHVIAIRRRPAEAFAVMSRVVQGAVVVDGVRGDASDAAARILAALDAGGQAGDDPDIISSQLVSPAG